MSEISKATLVDGVEFYSNGTERGMSKRGLARFVGKDESTIRLLCENVVRGSAQSKYFKAFLGKGFTCGAVSVNNAIILDSKFCAAVVKYYAFEASGDNSTAMKALEKFVDIGIDSFIDQTTGVDSSNSTMNDEKLDQLLSLMLELKGDLAVTKAEVNKFKKVTVNAPGLQKLVNATSDIDEADEKNILPGVKGESLTLREWLDKEKGLVLCDTKYRRLRLKVAECFKMHQEQAPKRVNRKVESGHTVKAYVYPRSSYPLLDICLIQILTSN